jgi:exopolyphosphatase / guanosine-5'-triphosphate,3'-diphosphate pyrophosphatase
MAIVCISKPVICSEMRKAVIDMGTNTFHLLVVETDTSGGWKPLFKKRIYVKLAEEGIERIGARAFERAVDTLLAFRHDLDAWQVAPEDTRAFGTAALRTALNAPELAAEIEKRTGIRPEIISGDREAELIFKGVRKAVPFPEHRVLIMDIGGGSVEFILADREQVYWQQSFPLGVAVLFRDFHQQDPIHLSEIGQLEQFLHTQLQPLWAALAEFPARTLIGASGTFDVIDLFLLDPASKPATWGYIEISALYPLYDRFICSTLAERNAMELLPKERAEMVVVALVLVRVVLEKAGITDMYTSTYALKEGMLENC